MRVVFFGTPDFAVPSMHALMDRHAIALVVTQPDRPAGRGMQLRRSPVASTAEASGIPVLAPQRAREPAVGERVAAAAPDIIVVVAYGQILPAEILAIPPHGAINVHASLLPRWRGASPIAAAIRAGDELTGVSIMQMEEGLDSGPVILQRRIEINEGETARQLSERLAHLGAEALLEGLQQIEAGTANSQPQDESQVTIAARVKKQDGDLDWTQSRRQIERSLRAYDPWPGVRLPLGGERIRVLRVRELPNWYVDSTTARPAGDLLEINDEGITLMAGDGPLLVQEVQPAGKRPMSATEFARGRRDLVTG
jgi:methionyl-tRNA formyltransferase